MQTRSIASATLVLVSLILAQGASALEPASVIALPDSATAQDVARWSRLPGRPAYVMSSDDPFAGEIEALAGLSNASHLTIEMGRYPGHDLQAALTRVAARIPTTLSVSTRGFATADEIATLDATGIRDYVLETTIYAGIDESRRLSTLKGAIDLRINALGYPQPQDLDSVDAIPHSLAITFVMQYWPGFDDSAWLNHLAHAKKLEIHGTYLSQGDLENLRRVEHLAGVSLHSTSEPTAAFDWAWLAGVPTSWSATYFVPSAAALDRFAAAGERSARVLTLMSDRAPSGDEAARLRASRATVLVRTSAPRPARRR